MKLKSVKLANAIKVGANGEETAYYDTRKHALEMDCHVIKITSLRSASEQPTFTTLYNCIYWVVDEQANGQAGVQDKDPGARASTKTKTAP